MNAPAPASRARLLPITLSQVVGLACGIAGIRLTSHLVAPADNGFYGVFVSLVPLGHGVVFTGLLKFAGRHWLQSERRGELFRAVLRGGARKLGWLGVAVALTAGFAAPDRWWWFAAALFVVATLQSVAQLVQTALQAMRAHWRDFGLSAAGSVTRALLPPLLYAGTGAGLAALVGGFTLHALVLALVGAWLISPWLRVPDEPAAEAVLGSVYEGPLFVALALAGWILIGLNRWIVAGFFGVETAGYFTLASNAAAILPSMLGTVALQYFQPGWFAREAATPESRATLLREIDRVALAYVALALAAAVALHAFMPWLIGPLVSPRYAAAAGYVLGAGCFMTAVTTGYFYHVLLIAARRERACGPADLAGAACLVVGGLLAAAAGREWFVRWLLVSPVVPWLVNRTLARRALFRLAAGPAPSPGP